LNHVEQAHGL